MKKACAKSKKPLPYAILFLDGNHKCFPEIFTHLEEMWNGGKIYRILPNILHLMRGQIYDLTELTVFTMGGGHSIDVMYCIPGRTEWPEERPGDAKYIRRGMEKPEAAR